MDVEALQRLERVLQSVETSQSSQPDLQKKRKIDDHNSLLVAPLLPPKIKWFKYFDRSSSKHYYHNIETQVTQWDVPEDYVDPIPDTILPSTHSSNLSTNTTNISYKSTASFTNDKGVFSASGASSYWDKMNRPDDKAGRQMSAFFDISTLEQNREEYKVIVYNIHVILYTHSVLNAIWFIYLYSL